MNKPEVNVNKELINKCSSKLKELLFGEGRKKADISLVWSLAFEIAEKQKNKPPFELISGIKILYKILSL